MSLPRTSRWLLVGGVCAAVGAAGGIVGSMAAPAKSRHHRHAANSTARPGPPPGRPFDRDGGPPVHADEVVLNKAGTDYITRTEDSGKVKSVSGNDVTITEGNGTVTYKDATVTIPDGATVIRNGTKATVADLQAGDFIHVAQSSDGTFVFAADSSWRPPFGRGDHHGPPPGGPPPGGPPPPGGF